MNQTRRRQLSRVTWGWKLKLPTLSFHHPQTHWWLICASYFAIILFLVTGPIFRVHSAKCKTNTQMVCPDFIVPEMNKYQQQLIYLLQTSRIAETLKLNIPDADIITVSPIWPDTLLIEIFLQPGFANLSIPASTSAFLVSKSGQLIDVLATGNPQLPTIIASSAADLIISDRLTDTSLVASLEIIKKCQEIQVKINTVDIMSPQDIRIHLESGQIAVLSSQRSVQEQVLRLQLILSQTTINLENKVIDLRYDRPALKQSL